MNFEKINMWTWDMLQVSVSPKSVGLMNKRVNETLWTTISYDELAESLLKQTN